MNKFVIAALAASLAYPALAQMGTPTTPKMPPDDRKPGSGAQYQTGPSGESRSSESRRNGMSTSGSPSASGGSAQSVNADSSTVRQVQQALSDKGYSPGPIDGIAGEQTQSALRDFQQSQGLPATGSLNSGTLSALGVSPTGNGNQMSPNSSGRKSPGAPSAESRHGASPGSNSGSGASGRSGGSGM